MTNFDRLIMSVIVLLSGRSWTSVQNTDLDDHLTNDGSLNGPTYLSRDSIPLNAEDFQVANHVIRFFRFTFIIVPTMSHFVLHVKSHCNFSDVSFMKFKSVLIFDYELSFLYKL